MAQTETHKLHFSPGCIRVFWRVICIRGKESAFRLGLHGSTTHKGIVCVVQGRRRERIWEEDYVLKIRNGKDFYSTSSKYKTNSSRNKPTISGAKTISFAPCSICDTQTLHKRDKNTCAYQQHSNRRRQPAKTTTTTTTTHQITRNNTNIVSISFSA